MKLTCELIPSGTHFRNLRSELTPRQWDYIRKDCYEKANHKCEVCDGKGRKHPVECHEVWSYDFEKQVQKLERTVALCPSCHAVKHLGFQALRGEIYFKLSLMHLQRINNMTEEEVEEYVTKEFYVHSIMSAMDWTLDISALQELYPLHFGETRNERSI